MAEKKLKNPWNALRDLDALAKAENVLADEASEKFREELGERDRRFGREGRRTPEQQAAWDAFVAGVDVKRFEIHTQEEWENFMIRRYLAGLKSGGLEAYMPGGDYFPIDWERVRLLAIQRGYIADNLIGLTFG